MNNSAFLYTPKDDSLAERILAFKSVLAAQRNVEKSAHLLNDPQWLDRLGSKEEITSAKYIITNSLKAASKNIKQNDIKEAKELGLLSPTELKQIQITHAKDNLAKQRDNLSKSSHLKHFK